MASGGTEAQSRTDECDEMCPQVPFSWTHQRTKKRYTITPHRELIVRIINGEVNPLRTYLDSTPSLEDEQLWCATLEIDNRQGVKETFTNTNAFHVAAMYGGLNVMDVIIQYGIGHLKDTLFDRYEKADPKSNICLESGTVLNLAICLINWNVVTSLRSIGCSIEISPKQLVFEYTEIDKTFVASNPAPLLLALAFSDTKDDMTQALNFGWEKDPNGDYFEIKSRIETLTVEPLRPFHLATLIGRNNLFEVLFHEKYNPEETVTLIHQQKEKPVQIRLLEATPLHIAAYLGHTNATGVLSTHLDSALNNCLAVIEKKENTSIITIKGATSLISGLVGKKSAEILKILLEHSHPTASVSIQQILIEDSDRVCETDLRHISSLCFAIFMNKDTDALKQLVDHLDPCEKQCKIQNLPWIQSTHTKLCGSVPVSALEFAMIFAELESIKFLLMHNVKTNAPKFHCREEVLALLQPEARASMENELMRQSSVHEDYIQHMQALFEHKSQEPSQREDDIKKSENQEPDQSEVSERRTMEAMSDQLSIVWNHEGKLMSWKDLGKELEFEDKDLCRIEEDNGSDTKKAVMQMLREWNTQMRGNRWKEKILQGALSFVGQHSLLPKKAAADIKTRMNRIVDLIMGKAPDCFHYGYYDKRSGTLQFVVEPGAYDSAQRHISSLKIETSIKTQITEATWEPKLLTPADNRAEDMASMNDTADSRTRPQDRVFESHPGGNTNLAGTERQARGAEDPIQVSRLGLGAILCQVSSSDAHRIIKDSGIRNMNDLRKKYSVESWGTVSCLARDRRNKDLFLLTAHHVLIDTSGDKCEEKAYTFSEIYIDKSQASDNTERLKVEDIMLVSSRYSGVYGIRELFGGRTMTDVAILPLSDTVKRMHLLEHHFQKPMSTADPIQDELVKKTGAKTGTTSGCVIEDAIYTRMYGWVFFVKSSNDEEFFADKGDSGALVYKEERGNRVALGMIHSTETRFGQPVYICVKIRHSLQAIKETFKKDLELFDDNLTPDLIMSHRFQPCISDIAPDDRITADVGTQTDKSTNLCPLQMP